MLLLRLLTSLIVGRSFRFSLPLLLALSALFVPDAKSDGSSSASSEESTQPQFSAKHSSLSGGSTFAATAALPTAFASGRAPQADCSVKTCELGESSLRFMLLGDWGGLPIWPYYTLTQNTVAKAMGKIGEEKRTHFQFAMGDNFYYAGVTSLSDKRFQKTFEEIYVAPALQTPWYAFAGNHDHHGNVTAQIKYSKQSKRWVFPDYYYNFKYELDVEHGPDVLIEFVVIDTILLCGNIKNDAFSLSRKANNPKGPADVRAANDQWTWIEQRLSKSKANYLFVAGHYPVYSIAEHGPTQCLIDRLEPLMWRYNVTAYLSGHDHNLQHLQVQYTGFPGVVNNFIVSGAGAYMDSSTTHKSDVPAGSSRFFYPHSSFLTSLADTIGFGKGGFVYAEVSAASAAFTFLRGDGAAVYNFTIPPRLPFDAAHD